MMNPLYMLLAIAIPMAVLCLWDARRRQLPGVLTLGTALLCLAVRFVFGGWTLAADGLLGGMLCGLFLLIPYLLKSAGGGDVKMLFAAGTATGLHTVMTELLFVSVAGLLLTVVMLLFGWVSAARIRHVFRACTDRTYDRAAGRRALPSVADERARVPFAFAIAAGTCVTLIYTRMIGAAL